MTRVLDLEVSKGKYSTKKHVLASTDTFRSRSGFPGHERPWSCVGPNNGGEIRQQLGRKGRGGERGGEGQITPFCRLSSVCTVGLKEDRCTSRLERA